MILIKFLYLLNYTYLYNNIVSGTVLACHKEWASKIQKIGAKSAISNIVTKTVNILNQPIKYT